MEDKNILNEVINSITEAGEEIKKKKRGRPPKNKTNTKDNLITTNKIDNEYEEIILHLKITKDEIAEQEKNGLSLVEIDKNINSLVQIDKVEDNIINNYKYLINRVTKENEEYKKCIANILPMYETQVRHYPDNIVFENAEKMKVIPKISKTWCYHCSHSFDNYPVYNIIGYINGIFIITGDGTSYLFCSFNCNIANLLNDTDFIKKEHLLKRLYYEIYKNSIDCISNIVIKPAPDKKVLEKFGGPYTIEQYRTDFVLIVKNSQILNIPFVATPFIVEETTKQNSKINYYLNNNPNTTKNIMKHKNSSNS